MCQKATEAPIDTQMKEFWSQVAKRGDGTRRINSVNFQRFLDNPDWDPKKEETPPAPAPEPKPVDEPDPTFTSYSITIRHGDNFPKRMKALVCGKNVNENITQKNFPVVVDKAKGNEQREVVLAHFNRYISSEKVIDILAKLGYRQGTFEELIAFGAAHPDAQRQFPIVALGSEVLVRGRRSVPALWRGSHDRGLGLFWFGDGWASDYRFLAVSMSA